MKRVLVFAAVSLGLGLGSIMPAEAGMPLSGLAQNAAQANVAENATWRCGPRRCLWVRDYVGTVPNFALGWGPPHLPNCYWKRGLLGKWRYKCD